jgi:uncharacterized protein (DUF1330 family)
MPAYWIAHVTITDPERYRDYQALAPAAFAAYGAVFLARGGESDPLEGAQFERHVIIQFPDIAAARCVFRRIRPPIPTTSGHLFRGIRPPVTRCLEAACFGYQF